jgi:F-type H+-transporting ATPase subunit O
MRAFSSAVDHTPPLKLFGIPGRYALATYTAASKQGVLDKVEAELIAFKDLLGKKEAFADFLNNPTVARTVKVDEIAKIFGGPNSTKVTKNLFVTMAANARLADTGSVVDAFVDLMKAKRGEVDATVVTATPLTKPQLKKLADMLQAQAPGKKVALSTSVNPAIMGGLTLQLGDKYLDLSVKTKLDNMVVKMKST